jgi:lipopolysaccharide export system permease protein
VTELDARRRAVSRVCAREGWYDGKLRGWMFVDGRVLTFDPDKDPQMGETMSSQPFSERFYPRYQEDPRLMMLIDRRPIELSFNELGQMVDYFTAENNAKAIPYANRYFGLIADVLSPLILIAIAIPFAVTGVRVNPVVGVSKSIGLFFVYFILKSVAEALATKQLVDPSVAAWLPDIGMTALAALLFIRLR